MPARRTVPAWAPATTVVTLLIAVLTGLVALPATAVSAPTARAGRTAAAAKAAKAATTRPDPLGVTITSLTPSTLKTDPTKGTVRVSGTITNDDDQTWQDINVHAFIGSTPLTTETELTEASLSDPTQDVGQRITTYGDFQTIAELAPGQSYSYSLAIPRGDLVDSADRPITAPGVYWFGVQVLGTDSDGRDSTADGRARTFLPLVGATKKKQSPEKTAIVVPLRQRVLRQPDGTLAAPENWVRRLSTGGRLDNLLTFGTDHPVSWLVDPAVIDAIAQLADGNPPRSIAATDGSATTGEPSAGATAHQSGAERAAADDAADLAKAWLARLLATLRSSQAVYALPYGDLDLAAAARHDPALYAVARQRSTQALTARGITNVVPVDAPIDGYLEASALDVGDSAPKLLLTDQAISGTVPAVASISGRTVVTTSSLVAAGGPPPGDQLGLIPVRQELLAQSALRLGTDDPVIAVLPADWSAAGDSNGFFEGLRKKWLQPTTIDGAALSSVAQEVPLSRLRYPDAELEHELPAHTFAAVDGLRRAGSVLQSVLSHNDVVATTVLDDALTSASYTARGGSGGAAAERSREAIDAQLQMVTVEAPPSVTLASDRGKFNATVVNGLDQDITVRVRAVADNGMAISVPRKLQIPANGRAGVLLTAKATSNGVHTVILELTDGAGSPLGSQTRFPIRTAQVSRIIWLFIGCGLGLLFAAIVVRLVRRVRAGARAERHDDDDPTASASAEAHAPMEPR
ncbi:DUF6049 family protein [Nocardioides sp. BP30]|uniref:DUF6049 family protein n=1 Tax=Nocardioides sp. BP30 TaxID=3036374 RepID=UPI00246939E7|nr:DUF6049 family protein [Nocardioides sp. BP30]WGL52538.1 DUF6049 family protein [Nocardioides sp. BP30]